MSLFLLTHNLREAYSAAKSSGSCQELITDLSGTFIYQAASGWGRVWKWIFNLIEFLGARGLKERKLASAMKKTEDLFLRQHSLALSSLKQYWNYLHRQSVGMETKESRMHRVKGRIIRWNRAALPFAAAVLSENKITALAAKRFPQIKSALNAQDLERLSTSQHLIDLEGCLHGPLPLALFKKLACGAPLKDHELKSLKKWIHEHNQPQSPLSVRPFHAALRAFVGYMQEDLSRQGLKLEPEQLPSLPRLELKLIELGLKVFFREDPVHLKWRAALKPGSTLALPEGGQITLGERIGAKEGKDNNLVFTVLEEPEKAVVIGINQAVLLLKATASLEKGWCLPPPHCHGIEPTGLFALYERLPDPFSKHTWQSKGWIHYEDKDFLEPLANMLKWNVKHEVSPHRLSARYIRFDSQGKLRSSKTMLPAPFDYTMLEDFIFDCSKENKTIFSYLMHTSGMEKHPYRNFYLKCLQDALGDVKKNSANLAAFNNVDDPRVEDRGDLLYDKIRDMRESCLKRILVEYIVPDEAQLEEEIAKVILSRYKQLHLLGRLWPDMEDAVVASVVKKAKLQWRCGL